VEEKFATWVEKQWECWA